MAASVVLMSALTDWSLGTSVLVSEVTLTGLRLCQRAWKMSPSTPTSYVVSLSGVL